MDYTQIKNSSLSSAIKRMKMQLQSVLIQDM